MEASKKERREERGRKDGIGFLGVNGNSLLRLRISIIYFRCFGEKFGLIICILYLLSVILYDNNI